MNILHHLLFYLFLFRNFIHKFWLLSNFPLVLLEKDPTKIGRHCKVSSCTYLNHDDWNSNVTRDLFCIVSIIIYYTFCQALDLSRPKPKLADIFPCSYCIPYAFLKCCASITYTYSYNVYCSYR